MVNSNFRILAETILGRGWVWQKKCPNQSQYELICLDESVEVRCQTYSETFEWGDFVRQTRLE